MQMIDLINGVFEFTGGLLLWMNCIKIVRDKMIRGVFIFPTVFFGLWGFWNLIYYPSLDQWMSFTGGAFVVTANTTWVVLALYYNNKNKVARG